MMEQVKRVFICGSALKGQPDHQNLQSATFVRSAKTAPLYRLHAAANGWHPAIYEVQNEFETGISIPGELYELSMESIYEYGSRSGFWRLHRMFTSRGIPVTVYGIAMALMRNPEAVAAIIAANWEIASHGYRL
jgi:peptidoglycan/xylan/chitin deacetylase (PgdA/CDA1 family)